MASDLGSLKKIMMEQLQREHEQKIVNLGKYTVFDTNIVVLDGIVTVIVPGLQDAVPSILAGDWIMFKNTSGNRKDIRSRVSFVNRTHSFVQAWWPASEWYRDDQRYVVLFNPSYHFSVRMERALNLCADTKYLQSVLFPSKIDSRTNEDLVLNFNNTLLNKEQKEFVNFALQKPNESSATNIRICFGPPGSGKTSVAVETIIQIISTIPNARAPSISAADTLTLMLASQSDIFDKSNLFRFNDSTRDTSTMPPSLYSFSCIENDAFAFPLDLKRFLQFKVVVATCFDSGILFENGLTNKAFGDTFRQVMEEALQQLTAFGEVFEVPVYKPLWTHCVVDEACQATEAESLVPISLLVPNQKAICLMFGDPKQLKPIVSSKVNRESNGECSLMQRLLGLNSDQVVILQTNYRARHPSLIMMPSKLTYFDILKLADKTVVESKYVFYKKDHVDAKRWPICFHGVKGKDDFAVDEDSKIASWFNAREVSKVLEIVTVMASRGALQRDISVTTPFRGQVNFLRRVFRKNGFSQIDVGNILDFQGKSKMHLILSCVRSTSGDALRDAEDCIGVIHRNGEANVAVTRSMESLSIVGNPDILCQDEYWRKYLAFFRRNYLWFGDMLDTDTLNEKDDVKSRLELEI